MEGTENTRLVRKEIKKSLSSDTGNLNVERIALQDHEDIEEGVRITIKNHEDRGAKILSLIRGNEERVSAALSLNRSRAFIENGGIKAVKIVRHKLDPVADKAAINNSVMLSHVLKIPRSVIIGLIERGMINKFPHTDADWLLLTQVAPSLARDPEFLRHAIRRNGTKKVKTIIETIDCKDGIQRIIRETLAEQPEIEFWSQWTTTNENGEKKKQRLTKGLDEILKNKARGYFAYKVAGQADSMFEGPAELNTVGEISAELKQRWTNAEAYFIETKRKARESARRAVKYARSGNAGITGVELRWHLYHLSKALRESTAEPATIARIELVQRKGRLGKIATINGYIRDLGCEPPLDFVGYVTRLKTDLEIIENGVSEDSREYYSLQELQIAEDYSGQASKYLEVISTMDARKETLTPKECNHWFVLLGEITAWADAI